MFVAATREERRNSIFTCRIVSTRFLAVVSCLAAFVYAVLVQQLGAQARSDALSQPAKTKINFDRDISPILKASCYGCHGPLEPKAQLRLDSEAAILRGGISGSAIIPGNSNDSLLVKRLMGFTNAPRMPLGVDPLHKEQIDLIRAWIDQGSFAALEAKVSQAAVELQPSHIQAGESPAFATKIRPILAARCYQCHGPDVQQNGLRLDSLAAVLRGSSSGKVIIPGNSERSILVRRLLGFKLPQMPYGGPPLSTEEINLIRHWIDRGASGPDSTEAVLAVKPAKHWAFMKALRPLLPAVKNAAWVRNPIDNFVLARLEKEGVSPSPEADKPTLIRRVSLDLIGLPPTPEEVAQFIADDRPDAYERLVDRLLASAHYGEKWARQWLDLAHYADSNGYWNDEPRPYAWVWRQWVIEALNRNMPFDQFTIEQIAGDLFTNATLEQKIATGFLRNTLTNTEGGVNKEEFRVEQVIDRTSTIGTIWLGLTVGCARCHNHKYDAITQKDFYSLFAFLNTADEVNLEAPQPGEMGRYLRTRAAYDKKRKALLDEYKVPELQADWEKKTLDALTNPNAELKWRTQLALLTLAVDHGLDHLKLDPARRTQKQQDRLTDHFIKWYGETLTKERIKELKFEQLGQKLEQLEEEYPDLTEAQTMGESPDARKTHILIRGDYLQPGNEVQAGTPAVLNPLPAGSSPTRLALARWLVSPDNPLTARVTVNRMWQEFFGRGIVETSDDFGARADAPSHPELLDWLAKEFVDSHWNVKRMHRLIVESATYRQSSKTRKELLSRDPNNRLLARQTPLRLPAELIRDVTLAASGLLDSSVGGKSIRPPMPAGGYIKTNLAQWKESDGSERYRRGLYIWFQRTSFYPQLMNFDAPDSLQSCTRRERSTTPLQALNLLNDPVFAEAGQGLAARVLRESKSASLNGRLDYAFRVCLARPPRPAEIDRLTKYYFQQKELLAGDQNSTGLLFPVKSLEGVNPSEAAVWVGISSVLLNLDEFIVRR